MIKNLSDEELWDLIGFIKISPIRYNTLKTLNTTFLMPSEIARRTGHRTTQISGALRELKKRELVICKNEHAIKGRIYENTELGREILEIIEQC